jgi:alpha-tubulin suppressor-like RCC1 family protein
MPTFYNFRQDGVNYSFDDVFIPADLFRSGNLWTWGFGNDLMLGNNSILEVSTPVTTFAGGSNWKQVTCLSYNGVAAIKTDGTLWVWGENTGGQLGTNDTTPRSTPVTTFAGGTDWKQVSAGSGHMAAIKTDGTLWTWGESSRNVFEGRDSNEDILTPVTTSVGGTNWKQVSCGYWYTAAVKTDGSLWTWGYSYFGQLGRPDDYRYKGTPVTTFSGGTNWADSLDDYLAEDLYTISGGGFHTAAIKTDGTLWTWGRGTIGQLGNANTIDISTPITTFSGGTNWKQVNAGYYYTSAIKTDGTLWAWGNNNAGQLGVNDLIFRSTPITTFAGGTNWKQVSSGNPTAAIKTDGTLWTWGFGSQGQLGNATIVDIVTPVTTFAGGTNWKQVSASNSIAAIKTDGTLWTWGNGNFGQLGNATTTINNSTPVTTFAGGTDWKQVSVGSQHVAAIKNDGTLWTWGRGTYGRLGNANITDRSTPVTTFTGGTNWKQVSCGGYHTTAIKTDGTLWVWGSNGFGSEGQLGNASTINVSTPVTTFAGGTNWKQVSAGYDFTLALQDDGISKRLFAWGNGGNGKLGNATITTTNSTPVTTFAGGTNWADTATTNTQDLYTLSAGGFFSSAIKTDGTLWMWGRGLFTQLGTNDIIDRSTPVTTFAGGTNWKQVSAGNNHTAAIKTDGTLWVWGTNTFGKLGINGLLTNRSTPVTTFAGGTNWKQVSAGNQHTAAIKTDGTLWTWGQGSDGKIGNNLIANRSTPVTTFVGGTDWKQVSAGSRNTAAIKNDGTLWTWGNGNGGELGFFTENSLRFTPVTTFAGGTNWADTATTNSEDLYTISAGGVHTTAIKTDGTLWTWGNGTSGQLGNFSSANRSTPVTTFAGGADWKQVSAGFNNHTAAIKTDGTLWTWGNGNSGRLGNFASVNRSTPVTTFAGGADWKQVSAGGTHTAAIKTNGTLWTWGTGSSAQLGTNDTITRSTPVTTFAGGADWKQVSAGNQTSAAIKTNGTLWTWGTGSSAQLGTNDTITRSTPVTTFAGGSDWKQVSGNNTHIAAIKTDGTLWTWGNGNSGQLGTNDTITRSTPVTTFAGGTNWKQVSASTTHTIALRDDGANKELYVFGNNLNQQLGINVAFFNYVSTPVTTFAGGTNWKQVSAGSFHMTAIKTDGTLWTWGYGSNSRLGTNDTINRFTPVTTFAGGTNWKQSSTGNTHTAAIKTDGTLWTWGSGKYGALGNGEFLWSFTGSDPVALTPITTFAGGNDWKQVSCGERHTLAIRGTLGNYELFAFGDTYEGELGGAVNIKSNSIPKPIFGNSFDWEQVDCGYHNTAAIKTNGTLWTWGRAQEGVLGAGGDLRFNAITPITTFAGGTNWKQVSVGGYYSNCVASAVKTDGTLWIWGEDNRGILGRGGDSNNDFVSTPITTFAGGTNWKSVSAGGYTVFGIKTDGTLWGWGQNYSSRLGVGDVVQRSTPVTTFAGGTNWKQIDHSFGYATAAVSYDDPIYIPPADLFRLFTWGYGVEGSLGNGIENFSDRSTPITTFAGGTNWKQISVGQFKHGAGIKSDGTLWVWGNNYAGKLGTADLNNRLTPVTTFAGGTNWQQVSCGGYYTCAIKTDGTLWSWGYGFNGVLGNANITNRSTPVTTFSGGTNWRQVSCGYRHTAAIKTDGTLWAWGFNGFRTGALGNNSSSSCSTPITTFAGGTNWKQVSCGYQDTTAAVKTDGTLWVWGSNTGLSLGINSTAPFMSTPVTTFAGGTNWKEVSAGGNFLTAAIKTDGTLWVWGSGDLLGINDNTNKSTPVTTFAGGTNWREVSASAFHTVAIKTDGTLWTWGDNDLAKLGTNDATNKLTPVTTFAGGTNWEQVSAGARLSGAITKN